MVFPRSRTGSECGFTLIELLVVVAIIGILAAIAIPNLITAVNRAKQKRTVNDIRTIATIWEAQAVDTSSYTASAATFAWPAVTLTQAELNSLLTPDYAETIPATDGWGTEFGYGSDVGLGAGGQTYAIRSAGWDKQFDSNNYDVGLASAFQCDIVFSNGSFVTYPQAAMKQ